MEHEAGVTGAETVNAGYGTKSEVTRKVKETKMDATMSEVANLIGQMGKDGNTDPGHYGLNWNNPVWLIALALFRGGKGGLFGGDSEGATAAVAASNSAKLDCLQQGQTEALMRSLSDAVNANITNLSNRVVDNAHTTEINAAQRSSALSAQLAQCCCDLRAGQANIVNELCKQTGITVASGVANTQRIVDAINDHANEENRDKLMNCQRELSNSKQNERITEVIREECGKDWGHGRGRRSEVK